MTVKELIEKLQGFNQNARVVGEFYDSFPELECRQASIIDGYKNSLKTWDENAQEEIVVIFS